VRGFVLTYNVVNGKLWLKVALPRNITEEEAEK